ncbi:MAG: hypothetical protein LC640_11435, partial [Frankia sp.]|nr:hypothetical protein [Frankia sp.]
WLGAHQRSADTLGALVLMGVRLYNPAVGRFLQIDPVEGGSANRYDYAYQDPVNSFDLDGRVADRVEAAGACDRACRREVRRYVKKHRKHRLGGILRRNWRAIAGVAVAATCVALAEFCFAATAALWAVDTVRNLRRNTWHSRAFLRAEGISTLLAVAMAAPGAGQASAERQGASAFGRWGLYALRAHAEAPGVLCSLRCRW